MAIAITPLSDRIGAEIGGLDLTDAARRCGHRCALNQALAEHAVLVFRDQSLEPVHSSWPPGDVSARRCANT